MARTQSKISSTAVIAHFGSIRVTLFDILRHISENKEFAHHLLRNLDFVTLVARNFETSPSSNTEVEGEESKESSMIKAATVLEVKKLNYIVRIIETIWEYNKPEGDAKFFLDDFRKCLNQDGLLLFCLNAIFNRNQPLDVRVSLAKLIRAIAKEDFETQQTIGAFMPIEFLTMIEHAQGYESLHSPDEITKKLIEDLDSDVYENVFLMWDSEIRNT